MALVPELRDRRREAGRGRRAGAAARPPLRPRRDARRDRPADEASSTSATRTTRPGRRTRAPSSTPSSTRVPSTCSSVVDQAYFEYVDDPDYPDAIEEYFKAGRRVAVLRTFSKIYGLAGLRVGYMVAPGRGRHGREQGQARVRRLERGAGGRAREPRRPRPRSSGAAPSTPRRSRARADCCASTGFEPAARRSPTSSTSTPARTCGRCSRRCSREGVIVRPLHGFGAPRRLASRAARRTRTSSSPTRSPGGRRPLRRAYVAQPDAAAADPVAPGARSSALRRRFRLAVLLDARSRGSGTWIAGDRAASTSRPYRLGDVGERTPDRGLPAGRRDRAAARAARRPALAEAAAGRRRRRPVGAPSSCSRWP